MNRKEEFQSFVGNSLPKEQFDEGFAIWSTMKDVLARERETKMLRHFKQRLARKAAIARKEAIKQLINVIRERHAHGQSGKSGNVSRKKTRKKYACLRENVSNDD